MTSVNLIPSTPLNAAKLAKTLAEEEIGLIRAKGFVTDLSGEKILIQIVGRRWTISAADPKFEDGMVCLGFKEHINPNRLEALAP